MIISNISNITNVKNNTYEVWQMCIYGYCRISTRKQSIERQIRNIKEKYPNATIVEETYTGTKIVGRDKWRNLINKVKANDIIVFDSVSRMSRDAEEGFELYERLFNKGVELVFLKEPHINTSTYREAVDNKLKVSVNTGDIATDELMDSIIQALNKYILSLAKTQIKLAFEQAEKEVKDLQQRTKEGIETARLAGKQIGQKKGNTFETKKSKEAKEDIKKYSKDFMGSLNDIEVMKLVGVSRNSYYKYKKELVLNK